MRSFLIVDDDPRFLQLYKILLNHKYGEIAVDMAENGAEALKLAARTEPDVILSDVEMPSMNGIEFYGSLKEMSPILAGRIALISGSAEDELEKFIESEEVPLLAKPFLTKDFYGLVDDMLERSAERLLDENAYPCKRSHLRMRLVERCLLKPKKAAQPDSAVLESRTFDYSKGGISVEYSGDELSKGDIASVIVDSLDIFEKIARVVWSKKIGDLNRSGLCWLEAT